MPLSATDATGCHGEAPSDDHRVISLSGSFNLVNGEGATVGAALAAHPDVDMISFTGSTRAGVAVSRAAAASVKRVTLELGGKGPNLLFADLGDGLGKAVQRGVFHLMRNSGQNCNAPSRMLIEASVYDEAVALATKACAAVQVGPPHQDGAHLGPVASAAQFDKVQSLIASGISEGARLLVGGLGRPPQHAGATRRNWPHCLRWPQMTSDDFGWPRIASDHLG